MSKSGYMPRLSPAGWCRLVVVLAASAVTGGLLGLELRPARPAAAPPKVAVKHARGRRAPAKAGHLRQLSAKRSGAKLRQLYAAVTPPAQWDSRTKGWVPPIVNQGSCGSCWDFSGTGMCSVAYAVAGYPGGAAAWMFSEQYTLDCGRNGGCNGDDNTTVLEWAQATGLPLTSVYGAYDGRAGRCRYQSSGSLYKISTWAYCDPSGGQGVTPASEIKAAIMLYGCVGAAVAAGDAWDSYTSGVYAGSGSTDIDHDIILVGWDDTLSDQAGKTVWILRNSWGSDWGMSGYMQIAEGADLVGTEAVLCEAPPPPASAAAPPARPSPGHPQPPVDRRRRVEGWTGQLQYVDGVLVDAVDERRTLPGRPPK